MKTLGAFCRTWLDEFVILVVLALTVGIISSWMGWETHFPPLEKAGLFILLASAIIAGAALLRKNRGDGLRVALSASLQRSEEAIEPESQANGLAARRITPAHIEASIASEQYFTAFDGVAGAAYNEASPDGVLRPFSFTAAGALDQVTFCVLVLHNGTKIVGINYGAIDPAQHSSERGREEARKHAIEQIWPLLGYELRSYLHAMKGPLTADSVGPAA